MEQGGFAQLQTLLEKALAGNDKKFLDVMLQIMKTFSMAIIKASYETEEAELLLTSKHSKTASSAKEYEEIEEELPKVTKVESSSFQDKETSKLSSKDAGPSQ